MVAALFLVGLDPRPVTRVRRRSVDHSAMPPRTHVKAGTSEGEVVGRRLLLAVPAFGVLHARFRSGPPREMPGLIESSPLVSRSLPLPWRGPWWRACPPGPCKRPLFDAEVLHGLDSTGAGHHLCTALKFVVRVDDAAVVSVNVMSQRWSASEQAPRKRA